MPKGFQVLYSRLLGDATWWVTRYARNFNVWYDAAHWSLAFINKYKIQLEFDFHYKDD